MTARRNCTVLRLSGVDVVFLPDVPQVEFHEATKAGQNIKDSRALMIVTGNLSLQVMAALWISQKRMRGAEALRQMFAEVEHSTGAWNLEMGAFYRVGNMMCRRPEA